MPSLGSKDIYLLNHFRASSPAAALGRELHYPAELTMTGHLRVDVILQWVLDTARRERQSRESEQGRDSEFNGFFVQWRCSGRKCDSAARKRYKPIEREERRGWGREKQPGCVSWVCEIAGVYASEWIGMEREEEPKKRAALPLWCDSSLKLIEKRLFEFFFLLVCPPPTRLPPPSTLLLSAWGSSSSLRWLYGGEEVTGSDRWQWGRGGWVNRAKS